MIKIKLKVKNNFNTKIIQYFDNNRKLSTYNFKYCLQQSHSIKTIK